MIEYFDSDSVVSQPLIKAPPSELEEEANRVLPRPFSEHSDSVLSSVLVGSRSSLKTFFLRPLVEHPNGTIAFVPHQPTADAGLPVAQVQPRPSVEYIDTGWSGSSTPPVVVPREGE